MTGATKRILVISDGKLPGATQKISFGQPLSDAVRSRGVTVHYAPRVKSKTEIAPIFERERPDCIVLSRYTAQNGEYWASKARSHNIPVIYHIDDDLLEVPRSLGEEKYLAYSTPERKQALRKNINACDLLYVSTPALAERFKEHGVEVPIIAGDIYCSVAIKDIGALLPQATGPVIGYMGTGGHGDDLNMILPAIKSALTAIPELQFEVFGTIPMPEGLEAFGNRIRHLPPVADYTDFIPFLRSLGWWVGLAPLEDNRFNRCKADTKWVEYTMSGMAVVASDLPVYHRACADGCGLLASSVASWEESIMRLLLDPQTRHATTQAAQDKLRLQYNHDALQQQVLAVFALAGLQL